MERSDAPQQSKGIGGLMDQLGDYVQILKNSLEKKLVILDRLIKMTESQTEILTHGEFQEIDWDRFNMVMTEKEEEINHINELDKGFQSLYDRVSEQLKANKEQYAAEIRSMQNLIRELEEKSVQIRTSEERNRALIERVMGSRKKEIRQARTSLKVASSYYQTMAKAASFDSSALDSKK